MFRGRKKSIRINNTDIVIPEDVKSFLNRFHEAKLS